MENCILNKIWNFEYNVMPFGLTYMPTIFQHLMNDVFCEFLDKFVICYLDDILIFFNNTEEHKEHVKLVIQKLQDVELYAKLDKCVFHQPQVEFLRYIISTEGLLIYPKLLIYYMLYNTYLNLLTCR